MLEFENLETDIENCGLAHERIERALVQHVSVMQKLYSVRACREELVSFESARFVDVAAHSSTASSAIPTQLPQQRGIGHETLFELNRILDGFVTNAWSVFDTLARELQWIYVGSPIGDIYFSQWPPQPLRQTYSRSSLWGTIDAVKQEPWYQYLGELRSTTVHESLIPPRINLQLDPVRGTIPISTIFLPDDPRTFPPDYTNQRDLVGFTQETHDRIVEFVEETAVIVRTDLPHVS